MIGAQRVMSRHRETDGAVRGPDLFEDGDIVDIAEPCTPELFWDHDAEQTELPELAE